MRYLKENTQRRRHQWNREFVYLPFSANEDGLTEETIHLLPDALKDAPSVRELTLPQKDLPGLSHALSRVIREVPTCKRLDFYELNDGFMTPEFLKAIEESTTLHTLCYARTDAVVSHDGVRQLMQAVAKSRSIRKVRFIYHDENTIEHLSWLMQQSTCLTHVIIFTVHSYNCDSLARHLAAGLEASRSVTNLKLRYCSLRDHHIGIICDAILRRQVPMALTMIGNTELSASALSHISKLLSHDLLIKMDLRNTTRCSGQALASALPKASNLRIVKYGHTLICRELLDALPCAVVHLDLVSRLNNETEAMANAIARLKGLTRLDLYEIFEDVALAIERHSLHLRHLSVYPAYDQSNETLALLQRIVDSGRRLQTAMFPCSIRSNGWVTNMGYAEKHDVDGIYIQRNLRMHGSALKAAHTLIAIRRFRHSALKGCPKEIVQIIARYVWETRGEIDTWSFDMWISEPKQLKL